MPDVAQELKTFQAQVQTLQEENDRLHRQQQSIAQERKTLQAQVQTLQEENDRLHRQQRSTEKLRRTLSNPTVRSILARRSTRVYVKDAAGHLVDANAPAADELGVPQECLADRKWTYDEVHGELYAEAAQQRDQQVIESGKKELDHLEYYARPGVGQVSAVFTSRIPLQDPDGLVSQLVVISRDVHRLEEPHARPLLRGIRRAIKAGPRPTDGPDEFTYRHDRAGNFLDADPVAFELYGRTETDIRQLNIRDIVAPEFSKLMEENIQDGFANVDATDDFPLRTLTPSGESVWVVVTARKAKDDNGVPCVQGVAHIIDTPGPEYRKFKRASSGASVGLWDLNIADNRIWVNDWLREVIGIDTFTLTLEDLQKVVHPDDWPRYRLALATHADSATEHFECEYRIRHAKDGLYHWMQSRGRVYRNRDDRATHVSGSSLDITASKDAESLLEHVAKLDQNMIFVKDKEGRFLFINHALAKLYDTTQDEAHHKRDDDFCATRRQIERFHAHDEMVLKGEPLHMPILEAVRGADRKTRYYNTRKVRSEWKGQPVVVGVATDVTKLVRANRRRKRQAKLLRSIINSVDIIIDCKDRSGRYTLVNQPFLDLFGCKSVEAVKRQPVSTFLPPEEAKKVEDADKASFRGETPAPFEVTLPGPDQQLHVFHITKIPLQDNGSGVLGILSVARDITDDKRRLESKQQEFEQIVNLANVGIFTADKDGKTTWVNEKGKEIEGLGPDDDIAEWPERLVPEVREEVKRKWNEFVQRCAGGAPADHAEAQYRIEEIIQIPDGGQRVLDVRANAERDNDRHLLGFRGVFTDITDLKQAQHQQKVSLETVSHNTTHAACALRDVLEQIDRQADTLQEHLLITAGETCLRAVEDLALIARNPAEPQTEQEEFDLWDTVDVFSVANMGGNKKAPKRALVSIDKNTVPRSVYGHRGVLVAVLQNLVANAAKQDDVTRPEIRLECSQRLSPLVTVQVDVEDDGKGLLGEDAEALRDKLSQPEEQLRAHLLSLVAPKHGRGIPLCQLWLMAIGSRMRLERGANGAMNRFSFTINVEERPARKPVGDNGSHTLAIQGPVLLLDDDPRVRAFLARRLLEWGVVPLVVCGSGEHAVHLVKQLSNDYFDLALLDLTLTEGGGIIDGYKTAKDIRGHTGSERPLILSISALKRDSERFKEAGIDDHLETKNMTRTELNRRWTGKLQGNVEPSPEPRHEIPAKISGWSSMLETDLAARIIGKVAALIKLMSYFERFPDASDKEVELKNLRHNLWHFLGPRNLRLDSLNSALQTASSATAETLSKAYMEMINEFRQTHSASTKR